MIASGLSFTVPFFGACALALLAVVLHHCAVATRRRDLGRDEWERRTQAHGRMGAVDRVPPRPTRTTNTRGSR